MSKTEVLLCQFKPGDRGLYCDGPIGRHPQYGRVYPDRKNTIEIVPWKKYLCREVHSTGKMHFVVVIKSLQEVLQEFLPVLTTTTWRRGQHIMDDIAAEATTMEPYGAFKATWYESTSGRARIKFVSIKFMFEGESLDFTVEAREAPAEVEAVQRRVRQCTGPAVDLSAVIARQRDSRRSTWR